MEGSFSAPAVPSGPVIGCVDEVSLEVVRGWACTVDGYRKPAQLLLFVDGEFSHGVTCDLAREDVRAAGIPTASVGFRTQLPARYCDGKPHSLAFVHPSGETLHLLDPDGVRHVAWPFAFSVMTLKSRVDGWADGAIRGWALRVNSMTGASEAGLRLLVTAGRNPVAEIVADDYRPDVGKTMASSPHCGFSFTPPPEFLTGRAITFHFTVLPGGEALSNSPVTLDFPSHTTAAKLHTVLAKLDAEFVGLWHLRREIQALLPKARFCLADYDTWARQYQTSLAERAASLRQRRAGAAGELPLVSVVCPVYRPRMDDFIAAVESVRAQTYRNWELILVDDKSDCRELRAYLATLAKQDARIKVKCRARNGGISAATNAAIALATGKYVAFFDHDDLLAPEALALFADAAEATDAKLVYCDEDKIDDAGRYSEPHFKPRWNYRLLLSQNYVCHLLFVERAHLARAGALDPHCDGAQDHALILRLAEITAPEAIVHIPEILYHWRKSPGSTALAVEGKAYAAEAGVRAISAHLARRGLEGSVSARGAQTLYTVAWRLPETPKISIIIPYREQIAMTQACARAVLDCTDYSNFELVLVDNWSTSAESAAFAAEMARNAKVRVMRVAEPFNFARLNNLAVAQTDAGFVLFLNNDVIVKDGNWLNALLGEALADHTVAAVGAKLIYPNGTVQHAGVVLGTGGVADHAHCALAEDDPGYMGRAIAAQEVSAVTGACMLCRRTAFDTVGGFDEANLAVAFNDIDLCLKLRAAGLRVVFTPAAVAEHHESLTRGSDLHPERQLRFFDENQVMLTRWAQQIADDDFYNPHFSRDGGIYRDLGPPVPVWHFPQPRHDGGMGEAADVIRLPPSVWAQRT